MSQQSEISQLHRLQGQLQGVEKMIIKNAKASETIQQIEAVRGALKTLEKQILGEITKNIREEEAKKSINYLLKIS